MPPLSPLARKFGITGLKPITPKDMRAAVRSLLVMGLEVPEVARAIRKRYRAGEWEEDLAKGSFGHLERFKLEDWELLAQGVRRTMQLGEIELAQGLPLTRPSKAAAALASKMVVEKRLTQAVVETEEIGDDPKKQLDALRLALRKRISTDEQADLLVTQAKSEHGPTSRAAVAHIIEILGMKAANVAEAPGSAPIFALPEGVGPSIR